jgi:hypothetical protein
MEFVLGGLRVRPDAGFPEWAKVFFSLGPSVFNVIRDNWLDQNTPGLHDQNFSYDQIYTVLLGDRSVRDMVTTATVDSVLERRGNQQLHPPILLVGVGMNQDGKDVEAGLAQCCFGKEDYELIAVDLVKYPHASESVRKVQGTGVDDIDHNSVDIICASWVNGLTFDGDRPRFVQALTQRLKPRGQIFMAEHKNSAQCRNAQETAFAYFEQVVIAQPGSSVEMRTSDVTPRCPYQCTMIVFTAAESPVSDVALPNAIKGTEIQIMNFGEQDGKYVRGAHVLFTVKLPAYQRSARSDWVGVYHVVTAEMMGYTGLSSDFLTRIEKEHLLGRGGCKGLKGLRGGHWMVLFALSDLPQRTRDVLATELSIGLLDLILQVAGQLAIVAGLAFSPETRLNQLTCTFGHFRYDERANVYSLNMHVPCMST